MDGLVDTRALVVAGAGLLAGRWPIVAVLEGYPYARGLARIYLEVPAKG
jgi:hypothetical protein